MTNDPERRYTVLGPDFMVSDYDGLRYVEVRGEDGTVERWTRDSYERRSPTGEVLERRPVEEVPTEQEPNR